MADQSLGAVYTASRKTADEAEVNRWFAEQLAQPDVLGPPSPKPGQQGAEKPPEKPGALKAIGTTFKETFTEGASHFIAGLGNRPKSALDFEGAGQQLLGVMQMAGALPAAAGQAFKQALAAFAPGKENEVAIKGGPAGETTTAGIIRSVMGAPIAMMLDPKIKAEIQKNPEPFAEALNADITYGELTDLLGQMVGIPLAMKAGRAAVGRARGGPAAPGATPEAPPPTPTEPRATLALPEHTESLVTPPPTASSAFETRLRAAQLEGPEAYAHAVADELRMALEQADAPPNFRDVLRERYRTQMEEAPKGKPEPEVPVPPAPEGPLKTGAEMVGEQIAAEQAAVEAARPGNLPSALDAALRRSEQAITEEIGPIDEKGAVSPALLARMALGAAAGGTQGDTPEERVRNAFLGMGIGAAMSGSLARKVAQSYKQSGLADESGALDFSKWRKKPAVQESEQAFQPNYARIEATPDVKAVMKNIHRMMKEDILERRGPARSNDQRVLEASDLIQSGKMTPERVLTLGDKEMLTDTEVTAARMISVRASQHAAEIRDQVVAGQPVPEGTLKQSIAVAGAIARNTRVAQTRIAQAQQAGAIRVRGEGVGYRPEDVASLADDIMPGTSDRQIATMMDGMKAVDQVERFSTWMTLFPRMLLQGVYFSYLSGKAIPRNIFGNGTMMAVAPVVREIGAYMPLWGSKKPGIIPGEGVQMARALGEGLIDQLRMVKHLDQIEATAQKAGVDVSSFKSDRRAPAGAEFVESLTENQQLQRLGDWYDNTTTFTTKVLDQTDVASKTINARMQHSVEAMRQATFEGHTGDAWEARKTELMDNITELSQTSRQRISDFANEQTFTQRFESRFMQAFANGPDNEWLNLAYRSFIMPFFRITVQSTDKALAHSPGLNLVSKTFWSDFLKGGADRQVAQSRLVVGGATMGAFMYLESQGLVTGNLPKDPKLRKLWEDAGISGRSFWDPIFEKWRSYDGLGPLTTLVAGAADTSMAARKMPEQAAAQLFATYIMSNVNTLDSRSFTQSPSNLIDIITTKNSDDQVENAMMGLRKQIAGWLKPGLLRELETLTDPEIRRALRSGAYEEGSLQQEWNALIDDLRSSWPGFSDAKDAEGNYLVPPIRNRVTGEPTIIDSWPFNPFPGREPKDIAVRKPDGTQTGVFEELRRLNGAGLDGWPEWMGPMAPAANYGLTTPNPRAGVRLTPQERDRYAVLFSQEVKNADGHTYAQALKATMQDPDYWAESDGSNGKDGGKAAWLQRLDRDFASLAKEALFMEGRSAEGQPGALERTLLEKQAEAGIQKTPTAQQPEVRGLVEDTLRNLRGLPSTLSR